MKTLTWILLLLMAAPVCAAEDLGAREAFTLRWTATEDWQAAESVKVSVENGKLRLTHVGADTGWAAPSQPVRYDRGATLHVVLSELENAQLTVQAEWFDADGKFLKATTAVDRINESPVTTSVKLDDLIPMELRTPANKPQDESKVQVVRVKLWIGGAGQHVTLDDLTIRAPRRWQESGVELVRPLGPDTPTTADDGMRTTPSPEEKTIRMQLDPDKKFAGLVFEPILPFDEHGVVMLDMATLHGGRIGLQAVCFDAAGKHLGAVDLLKDIDESGLHETTLSIYRSAFPPETASIRYKLWLGGNNPIAHFQGLYYGKLSK